MSGNKHLKTIFLDGVILFVVSTVLVLVVDLAFSGLKEKTPKDDPVVAAIFQDKAADFEKTLQTECSKAEDRTEVVRRVDEHGVTALARVAYSNLRSSEKTAARDPARAAMAKVLLAAGADVRQADKDAWTPLHWAAWSNLSAVVDVLVQARAAVDAADRQGNTALILAARRGNTAVVERLLAAGASRTARNAAGLDARAAAEAGIAEFRRSSNADARRNCERVVELLR